MNVLCTATCCFQYFIIYSGGGAEFPHPSRPALELTQPPIQYIPGFPRCKAAGAWLWPHNPSRAEVKERVELYLYSAFGLSWPVLGNILQSPVRGHAGHTTCCLCDHRPDNRSWSRGVRIVATELWMLVHSIFWSAECNVRHICLLAARILRWLLCSRISSAHLCQGNGMLVV